MLSFCTLFDSNYLAKGLCMYNSLKDVCSDFCLYIFAFDDDLFSLLTKMELEHVTVISLSQFEDKDLLKVKPIRTKAEYCWTSTPSTILYCLKKFKIEHCTYIDADLFFYNDPKILVEEMGKNDVLITEHRYTPQYDQSLKSGKYCVQFMCFKNTENGLNVLNWWRNACLDWCYNRVEEGKFGDQKYLDDWTTRFEGVYELKNIGGGVAPWNVQQYDIKIRNKKLYGIEKITNKSFEVVFYHFHHVSNKDFKLYNEFYLGPYYITNSTIKNIYQPFIKKLIQTDKKIRLINYNFDCLGSTVINYSFIKLVAHLVKNSFKRNKIIWWRQSTINN